MKRFFIIILTLICFNGINSQICTSSATTTVDGSIKRFKILGTTLDVLSPSMCVGYTDNKNIKVLLNKNQIYNYEIEGGDCENVGFFNYGTALFIDVNNNKIFDNNEKFFANNTSLFNNLNKVQGTFTIPSTLNIVYGEPLAMRLKAVEDVNGTTINACGTFNWGEVEDYTVEIVGTNSIKNKSILNPDSVSACAETFLDLSMSIENNGDYNLENSTATINIKSNSLNYTKTINVPFIKKKTTQNILVDNIFFPKEEYIEIETIISNSLDSKHDDDTIRKVIYMYKKPIFNFVIDSGCLRDTMTMSVSYSDTNGPTRIVWQTHQEDSTIKIVQNDPKPILLDLYRYNCKVSTSTMPYYSSSPIVKKPNDTTLCFNQQLILSTNTTNYDSVRWYKKSTMIGNYSNSNYNIIAKDTNEVYFFEAHKGFCKSLDSVVVKSVIVPAYSKVNDSVCEYNDASLSFELKDSFKYLWYDNTNTNYLIFPKTSTANEGYKKAQLFYEGCKFEDSVYLKVVKGPNFAVSNNSSYICDKQSVLFNINGPNNVLWFDSSTAMSRTFTPTQSTKYNLRAFSTNSCFLDTSLYINIYPKMNMYIYSNKLMNNLCNDDSIILYVNGANNYRWVDNITDSVRYEIPKESTTYTVIGFDKYNCKDTLSLRVNVLASSNVSLIEDSVCQNNNAVLDIVAPLGTTYKWSNGAQNIPFVVAPNKTTKYPVIITTQDLCEYTKYVEAFVYPQPKFVVKDVVVCKGENAIMDAVGENNTYRWYKNNVFVGSSNSIVFVPNDIDTLVKYKIEAIDKKSFCVDSLFASAHVIHIEPLEFINLKDSYICPTIPITLAAKPNGGIFDGEAIENRRFMANTLSSGFYTLSYEYTEPTKGCKDRIDKQIEIFSCESDIANNFNNSQIKIGPNPIIDDLYISIENQIEDNISIYLMDAQCKNIMTFEYNNMQTPVEKVISFSDLAKGIYFLNVETKNLSRTYKLLNN